jgi:isocitrate dehydrogenase kinase/phosphatase
MNSKKTAHDIAYTLHKSFLFYNSRFYKVTKGAKQRFEKRQWNLQKSAVKERIILHNKIVDRLIQNLKIIDHSQINLEIILKIIELYKAKTRSYPNSEIAYSFGISVLRTFFPIELPFTFWEAALNGNGDFTRDENIGFVFKSADLGDDLNLLLKELKFKVPYKNLEESISNLKKYLTTEIIGIGSRSGISFYRELFYRNNHAYLLGYFQINGESVPFVMAFENNYKGIKLDACVLDPEDILNIFSFSRSYFQNASVYTATLMEYLKNLIPTKQKAQLYINLGYQEHGKELALLKINKKIYESNEQFVISPSIRGKVMLDFTINSSDVVFKVFLDDFSSIDEVMDKYHFISLNDRVGRLPDIQYFEKLSFPARAFSQELFLELTKNARNNIVISFGYIEFKNICICRKLTPLNIYLIESNPKDVKDVLQDLGKCIKELASVGLFTENFQMKNFGVTDKGKVIFTGFENITNVSSYDFLDEPIHGCDVKEVVDVTGLENVKKLIYPVKFLDSLLPNKLLKNIMSTLHGDLFTPYFWNLIKVNLASNGVVDIKPYKSNV